MIVFDILALDGGGPTSLGLTLDVLDTANLVAGEGRPRLGWRVLGHSGRSVALRHGVSVASRPWRETAPGAHVIVPGFGGGLPETLAVRLEAADVRSAARWLASARARGGTLAASCTGVFLLAEAGALDGHRCTTTWWLAAALACRAPKARVIADAMLVEDGGLLTGGAVTAQLDLMLALVERHLGADVATEVGRRLAAGRRPSQAPFMTARDLALPSSDLARVEGFVAAHLARPIAVADIADALGVSARTLARRVRAATGLAPARYIQKIRVEAALRLIGNSGAALDDVARQVGLADASALHRLIVRHTGQAPGRFRAAARGLSPVPP